MNWICSLLVFFYEALFGCRHRRLTRPFTLAQETYKVCLDCGHKIYYSRERMEPLTGREVRRLKAARSGMPALKPELSPIAQTRLLISRAAEKSNAA